MAESSNCTKSLHKNEPANEVLPSCSVLCTTQNSSCVEGHSQYTDDLDVLMELVCSLLERDYEKSLQLCQRVIQCEPSNRIALQLFPALLKKIVEDKEKKRSKSGDESTDSSSCGESSSGSTCSSSRCSCDSSGSSSSDNLSACADSGSSSSADSESDTDDVKRHCCKYNLKNS